MSLPSELENLQVEPPKEWNGHYICTNNELDAQLTLDKGHHLELRKGDNDVAVKMVSMMPTLVEQGCRPLLIAAVMSHAKCVYLYGVCTPITRKGIAKALSPTRRGATCRSARSTLHLRCSLYPTPLQMPWILHLSKALSLVQTLTLEDTIRN